MSWLRSLACLLIVLLTTGLCLPQPKRSATQKILDLIEFSSPSSEGASELPAQPYEFGYAFGDGRGVSQHHSQVLGEDGVVKGSYGYVDPLGVYRSVEYVADAGGYRAVVRSNEPGIESKAVAVGRYFKEAPPYLMYETASEVAEEVKDV